MFFEWAECEMMVGVVCGVFLVFFGVFLRHLLG